MKTFWPFILAVVGVLLIPFGFVMAMSGDLIGVVLFCLGLVGFLIGSIFGTIRFAIRRRLAPHFTGGLAAILLIAFALHRYCYSLFYLRGAREDSYQLWMAALKPFTGSVYYVGGEGEFSYFRAGAGFPGRYKAPTAKLNLPRTFSLGKEEPYLVTEGMVHYYE